MSTEVHVPLRVSSAHVDRLGGHVSVRPRQKVTVDEHTQDYDINLLPSLKTQRKGS